ncbi:unnamed protein product [Symbiodinium natans]|uniref:Methyltransferase FkbM domain-containing protein n=1 Tax=Symbiodinium natans TaxID=878477 RepID=A0A812PTL1_9DINO|nr:unnamed protein product [Symbiodinium natans]
MRARSACAAKPLLRVVALCLALQASLGFLASRKLRLNHQRAHRCRLSAGSVEDVVDVAPLFHRIVAAWPQSTLVQIGACDGDFGDEASSNDPVQRLLLQQPAMRALLVEANPAVFATLLSKVEQRFPGGRVTAVNVAVTNGSCREAPFFVVSPKFAEDFPRKAFHWACFQLGSMDRQHVAKHHVHVGLSEHDFAKYIEEILVPALTPAALLKASSLRPEAVSILAVDAEGFDDVIVRAFLQLPGFEPRLISFEVAHLDVVEKEQMIRLLAERGYKTAWAQTDMSEDGRGDLIAWK